MLTPAWFVLPVNSVEWACIKLVGLDALTARVEPLGRYNDFFDSHFLQGAMKVITEEPGLAAGVELGARGVFMPARQSVLQRKSALIVFATPL